MKKLFLLTTIFCASTLLCANHAKIKPAKHSSAYKTHQSSQAGQLNRARKGIELHNQKCAGNNSHDAFTLPIINGSNFNTFAVMWYVNTIQNNL